MYECIIVPWLLPSWLHSKHTRVYVLEIDLKVGAKIDKTSKHNYFDYLESGCIQVIETDEFEFSLGRQYNSFIQMVTNHG